MQLETIFLQLSQGFRKLDKLSDGGKQQALLKELTAQMQEAKTCVCACRVGHGRTGRGLLCRSGLLSILLRATGLAPCKGLGKEQA